MAGPKSVQDLLEMKHSNSSVAWITAYDYPSAFCVEQAGIDMILIGDSGAMVQYGMSRTSGISMNLMIEMAAAVRRGAPHTLLVGDMPRGSYEFNSDEGVRNALRFALEGSCDLIKVEGATNSVLRSIEAISEAGVPVIGHLGLTPQSLGTVENYRVVAKQEPEIRKIKKNVSDLINAGVVCILLEAIPPNVSIAIKSYSNVPIYGIGAGPSLDGQLLIYHDVIGYYPKFRPKFAKQFVSDIVKNGMPHQLSTNPDEFMNGGVGELIQRAVKQYIFEVKNAKFPTKEHSYKEIDSGLVDQVFNFS